MTRNIIRCMTTASITLILLMLWVVMPTMTEDIFAISSEEKTVYDEVIVKDNYAYCSYESGIARVDLDTHAIKILTSGWGSYDCIHSMKMKGGYIYFITGNTDEWFHIYRIKKTGGKAKKLAKWADKYMIKGSKIYYTYIHGAMNTFKVKHKVMKLDGSSKKGTKVKAVMKSRNSNQAGYDVVEDKYGRYSEYWLIEPDGEETYLGSMDWY